MSELPAIARGSVTMWEIRTTRRSFDHVPRKEGMIINLVTSEQDVGRHPPFIYMYTFFFRCRRIILVITLGCPECMELFPGVRLLLPMGICMAF